MKWSAIALLIAIVCLVVFVVFPKSGYSLEALFLAMYFIGVTLICLTIEDGANPS